jgi:fimbrial isopeptide formation D2 family protein/LPXTG-motif cell wall-anchored protein
MKKLKKLAALVLALTLVLGTSLLAGAQTQNANSDTTNGGSITINDATNGKTYNIYRIFDLTLSGEATETSTAADGTNTTKTTYSNYAYSITSDWVNFFIGDSAAGKEYLVEATADNKTTYNGKDQLSYGGKTYYININDNNLVAFTKAALTYAAKLSNNDGQKTADGTTVSFPNIKLGYYLVYPVGAAELKSGYSSICSLTTTNKDASVNIKADYPSISKEITGITRNGAAATQDGTVQVGDTVTYTITGTVPDTTGYNKYTYKVSDTMSEGLTFGTGSTVNVKFGTGTANTISATTDVNANPKLTIANNGFVLEYDMVAYLNSNSAIKAGDPITITYSATINSKAVDTTISNEAKLVYSNDPTSNTTNTGDDTKKEVDVYSFNIDITKYVTDSNTKLGNAVFVLSKGTGADKEYLKQDETTKVITWESNQSDATKFTTSSETDKLGTVSIDGLAAGTYYLEETTAPAGYNKLANPITIVLTATPNNDGSLNTWSAAVDNKTVTVQDNSNSLKTYLNDSAKTLTVGVENSTGNLLPSTGGMGTTIFFVAGGILVVGAMILLIARWRMKMEG